MWLRCYSIPSEKGFPMAAYQECPGNCDRTRHVLFPLFYEGGAMLRIVRAGGRIPCLGVQTIAYIAIFQQSSNRGLDRSRGYPRYRLSRHVEYNLHRSHQPKAHECLGLSFNLSIGGTLYAWSAQLHARCSVTSL